MTDFSEYLRDEAGHLLMGQFPTKTVVDKNGQLRTVRYNPSKLSKIQALMKSGAPKPLGWVSRHTDGTLWKKIQEAPRLWIQINNNGEPTGQIQMEGGQRDQVSPEEAQAYMDNAGTIFTGQGDEQDGMTTLHPDEFQQRFGEQWTQIEDQRLKTKYHDAVGDSEPQPQEQPQEGGFKELSDEEYANLSNAEKLVYLKEQLAQHKGTGEKKKRGRPKKEAPAEPERRGKVREGSEEFSSVVERKENLKPINTKRYAEHVTPKSGKVAADDEWNVKGRDLVKKLIEEQDRAFGGGLTKEEYKKVGKRDSSEYSKGYKTDSEVDKVGYELIKHLRGTRIAEYKDEEDKDGKKSIVTKEQEVIDVGGDNDLIHRLVKGYATRMGAGNSREISDGGIEDIENSVVEALIKPDVIMIDENGNEVSVSMALRKWATDKKYEQVGLNAFISKVAFNTASNYMRQSNVEKDITSKDDIDTEIDDNFEHLPIVSDDDNPEEAAIRKEGEEETSNHSRAIRNIIERMKKGDPELVKLLKKARNEGKIDKLPGENQEFESKQKDMSGKPMKTRAGWQQYAFVLEEVYLNNKDISVVSEEQMDKGYYLTESAIRTQLGQAMNILNQAMPLEGYVPRDSVSMKEVNKELMNEREKSGAKKNRYKMAKGEERQKPTEEFGTKSNKVAKKSKKDIEAELKDLDLSGLKSYMKKNEISPRDLEVTIDTPLDEIKEKLINYDNEVKLTGDEQSALLNEYVAENSRIDFDVKVEHGKVVVEDQKALRRWLSSYLNRQRAEGKE